MTLFETLELPELSLELNNIGTPEDRENFKIGFRERVKPHLANLCTDCQARFETNPMRMLDCKVDACKAVYATPDIETYLETDFTGEESQRHYKSLTDILTVLNIPFKRNFKLVRGLDYYTKTVFEITSTHLGAQNAVCGGGRYNNLVSMLGGEPTPATGWALGMERLVSLLPGAPKQALDYYLVTDQHARAFEVAERLRAEQGKTIDIDLTDKNFGKQLEAANKRGAKFALILGEQEASANQITVKNLATGDQTTQSLSDLNWA